MLQPASQLPNEQNVVGGYPTQCRGLPKGAMLPFFQSERLGSNMTQWKECWRRSQGLGFNPYSTLNTWVILAKPTYWQKKRRTEDEMIEWHHQLDGHEFEQASGVSDGSQESGSLACCSPWGPKESDKTEQLNWTDLLGEPLVSINWEILMPRALPLVWLERQAGLIPGYQERMLLQPWQLLISPPWDQFRRQVSWAKWQNNAHH